MYNEIQLPVAAIIGFPVQMAAPRATLHLAESAAEHVAARGRAWPSEDVKEGRTLSVCLGLLPSPNPPAALLPPAPTSAPSAQRPELKPHIRASDFWPPCPVMAE